MRSRRFGESSDEPEYQKRVKPGLNQTFVGEAAVSAVRSEENWASSVRRAKQRRRSSMVR
jgi:hypothetical protein